MILRQTEQTVVVKEVAFKLIKKGKCYFFM